jgi:hypothetical protein
LAVRPARETLLFLAALGTASAAAQEKVLSEAEIAIALSGSEAQVSARYRIVAPGARMVLYAPRFPGLHLLLQDAPSKVESLDTLPGLFRLALQRDTAAEATEIDLRYRLAGDLSRLPIFVPEAPTSPPRSRVAITVSAPSGRRISRDRFPRLRPDSGGVWRGSPDHLPSFVALLEPSGPGVPRIAEWSVVAAAAGGTLLWLVRLRNWRVR